MAPDWIKRSTLVGLVLMGSCESDDHSSNVDVEIYYKPFNIETLLPVTPANIEQQADCVLVVPRSSPAFREIHSILNNARFGKFYPRFVRVKIVMDAAKELFIERDGGISIPNSESERRLDPDGIAQLGSVLEALASEQDYLLD